MDHVRAGTEFLKGETSRIFFRKFSLRDKWNSHLIHIITYFLKLCGISYKILKLKCHRALKLLTS